MKASDESEEVVQQLKVQSANGNDAVVVAHV
jgi:hypothetical protein